MISGKQLNKAVQYMFTSGSSFLAPTASFIATPSAYTIGSLPASVVLSGSIIPNDGTSISWSITDGSGTVMNFGTSSNPSFTLPSVPSTISSNIYNLNVTFTDPLTNNTLSLIVSTVVVVSAAALVGQLNSPTQLITVPGDLTPYESSLTVTDQVSLMNMFSVVASNIGRIVFVIPDNYGTVSAIEDGVNLDVLDQFTVVNDPSNDRVIYTSINAVTAATYNYKIVF